MWPVRRDVVFKEWASEVMRALQIAVLESPEATKEEKVKRYTVVVTWDPEGKVYSASVPALPGCHTWGKTKASAFRNALDAIETYMAAMRKLKQPLPREVEQRVAEFA